ncbi:MAG TPA: hypothetical protein V6C57_29660 [Coleofasciculaceae cyanobacterium]
MAKILGKRIIPPQPQREVEEIVSIACDLCGKDGGQEGIDDSVEWGRRYEVDRISVAREAGSVYPDSRYTTTESFHVCPECWKSKVVEWFKSQGAKATIEQDSD